MSFGIVLTKAFDSVYDFQMVVCQHFLVGKTMHSCVTLCPNPVFLSAGSTVLSTTQEPRQSLDFPRMQVPHLSVQP
jgi:hypothetical protein